VIDPIWPLGVGGRLSIDGEAIIVSSVDGAEVQGFTVAGEGPVRADTSRAGAAAGMQRAGAVWIGAA
jgi:hypothetical protein